jgi:omega-amidase
VTKNKAENIENAILKIKCAVTEHGAQVVALPECFNSPYGNKYFAEYSEVIPGGETSIQLSNVAKELKVHIIGGTIPEKDPVTNKLYNTCTIWSPEGVLIDKYRKVIRILCFAKNKLF